MWKLSGGDGHFEGDSAKFQHKHYQGAIYIQTYGPRLLVGDSLKEIQQNFSTSIASVHIVLNETTATGSSEEDVITQSPTRILVLKSSRDDQLPSRSTLRNNFQFLVLVLKHEIDRMISSFTSQQIKTFIQISLILKQIE